MRVMMWDVMRAVCEHHGLLRSDLRSHNREARPVRARMIAMYLGRTMIPLTFPRIGSALNRDPSTVFDGVKRMQSLMKTDEQLRADVFKIAADALRICRERPEKMPLFCERGRKQGSAETQRL